MAAGTLQHRAGHHPDPLIEVEAGEPAADLGAEDRREWRLERLDHRHLDAELPRGGGDLLSDEAGADDRQSRAGPQL